MLQTITFNFCFSYGKRGGTITTKKLSVTVQSPFAKIGIRGASSSEVVSGTENAPLYKSFPLTNIVIRVYLPLGGIKLLAC